MCTKNMQAKLNREVLAALAHLTVCLYLNIEIKYCRTRYGEKPYLTSQIELQIIILCFSKL